MEVGMTFLWPFRMLWLKLDYQSRNSQKKSIDISWLLDLTFSLTFYDFSVISKSKKVDLSQWKVRYFIDFAWLFLSFSLTFCDWNLTSQSRKSQLKSYKLLDFHQHCLTFPWIFLNFDFLWLRSQVAVKKNRLHVMDLADQDGLDMSLGCGFKGISDFRGFDEALTAK